MPVDTEQFYSRLPVNEIPLSELLMEEHLFFKIPSDWHVVITDVKKSTIAVNSGLHETVNLVATGSIVAVLNIAYRKGISIPFFFGGDGATFIVPDSVLNSVINALILHQRNTRENFNLLLRVGHVPVEDIYARGYHLNVTKLKSSDLFSIPIILGGGLSFAERVIKKDDYSLEAYSTEESELDLSGMQCRWDKIRPPENYDEVVSLLVVATGKNLTQAQSFKQVIDKLDEIYGTPEARKPITISGLKLKGTLAKIGNEMRVKFGKRYSPLYLFGNWFKTALGSLYFRTKTGRTYLKQLVALTDTLVIDGRINTVISGTQAQRIKLQEALDEMERDTGIVYGLYVSRESIMSCYVRNMNEKHIHFVDGSDGGYTKAAIMLKNKLAVIQE